MQEDPGIGGAAPGGNHGIDVDVAFEPGGQGAEYTWARGTTDAIPGNGESIRDHAGRLETKATDLRDYLDEIARLEPAWTGPASEAFLELKDTLRPRMELAAERFDAIAAALYDYADELDGAQTDANGARDNAGPLLDDLEGAEADLANAEEALDGGTLDEWQEANPDEPWLYGDDPEGEVTRLQGLIEDHWSDFCDAFDRRWTAAETCTEAIEDSTSDTGTTGQLNDSVPEREDDGRDYATDLQGLIDDGADAEEINDLLAQIEEHADDPAFAVAFSEEFGIANYVAAIDAGADPEALGAVLDTGMNALSPAIHEDEWVPYEVDLHDNFVNDLVVGYEPDDPEDGRHLANLVSHTDPPTQIAVNIASNRLSPILEELDAYHPHDNPDVLYDLPEFIPTANAYMEMLGRNPDASTAWLAQFNNIDIALTLTLSNRPREYSFDTTITLNDLEDAADSFDRRLADIAEHGITHSEDSLRQPLMNTAIDSVAEYGIANPHLYPSLTAGVEHNVDLLDQRINGEGSDTWEPTSDFYTTHAFLRNVMGDPSTLPEIYGSISEFESERLSSLPSREADAERRETILNDSGRFVGVLNEAHTNASLSGLWDEYGPNDPIATSGDALIAFILGEAPPPLGTAAAGGFTAGAIYESFGQDPDALNDIGSDSRLLNYVADVTSQANIARETIAADPDSPIAQELRHRADELSFVDDDGMVRPIDELAAGSIEDGDYSALAELAEWLGVPFPHGDEDQASTDGQPQAGGGNDYPDSPVSSTDRDNQYSGQHQVNSILEGRIEGI